MCDCFSLSGAAPRAPARTDGADGAAGPARGPRTESAFSSSSPWVDVHAHPGRCFLRGLPEQDGLRKLLGSDDTARAVEDLRAGGVALSSFSTVGDLRVLSLGASGIEVARDFEPGEAWSDHRRQIAALLDLAHEGSVRLVLAPGNLTDPSSAGVPGMFITCEGGDFLEGRAARVEEVFEQGARSITLVHYRVNELGDIQTAPPRHGGLTPFGAEVVAEMNRLGMIIDLAHATWDVTRDVLDLSSRPVMISHSHLARGEDPHPRLLSREHALAVARAGGVLGAWPAGIALESFEDFLDEILRMVELLGAEHVSIGTDMDANYQPVMSSHREMPSLAAGLDERGLGEPEIALVMGGNFLRLFESVVGA